MAGLSLAIILSGSEINSLQDFLYLRLWYHFQPCSAFSGSGSEQQSGFFIHGKTC
jgi:hypothetical protein